MSFCSVNIDVDIEDHYTCFTKDELKEIIIALSKDKKNKIDISFNKTKKELWFYIYNKLKSVCDYESCWVDLKFINNISDKTVRDKIKYFTIKPKMVLSWLSTDDINNVLQQYQEFDKSFYFMGALPSDFYKLIEVKYSEIFNYKKIGIVFNLDNHKKKGSHWVSFLIDNNSRTLEYFDSVGNKPNKNIKNFINIVDNYLRKSGLIYTQLINENKHQYENNECGVYSIYFIIQRLLGYSFNDICKKIISDKKMNDFRKHIFTIKK